MARITFVPNETPVSRWLTRKFLDWQSESGSKKSVTDFAKHLGVSRVNASRYLSGDSEPEDENLQKIGAVLGFEIYDLLGRTRPDPQLQLVISAWGKFTDEEIASITRTAELAKQRKGPDKPDGNLAHADKKRKA